MIDYGSIFDPRFAILAARRERKTGMETDTASPSGAGRDHSAGGVVAPAVSTTIQKMIDLLTLLSLLPVIIFRLVLLVCTVLSAV